MRPPHERTDENAQRVYLMAGWGLTRKEIAEVIGISDITMKKYYADDYRKGRLEAYATVTKKLFQKIKEGHAASIYFYLKTQWGWREKQEIKITTDDEPEAQVDKLNDDELAQLESLHRKLLPNPEPEADPGGAGEA